MTQLQSTRHAGRDGAKSNDAPPCRTGSSASSDWPNARVNADDFRICVFDGDKDIGPTFSQSDGLGQCPFPTFH